jgi:DNA polymerase III alpha subunit
MIQNKFGENIFSDSDIADILMQGNDLSCLDQMIVDKSVNIDGIKQILLDAPNLISYQTDENLTIQEFDQAQQQQWFMPVEYQELDIAEYILSLCDGQDELQRVGQELLLFQERDMFPLLRYLKYLVDTMKSNNIIWGVGRGSSVASYVLYKLGVHRVNSLYYDLDIRDFLR